ncbi:MAG TPA: hypothetical protein VJH65_03970 [Candidatus Nanoarchaeia archaeon]|nr:hypothetical protein [Candidatus Nanoarchaeia archaeon]
MTLCQYIKEEIHLFQEKIIFCNLEKKECPYNITKKPAFFTESKTGIEYVCSEKGIIKESETATEQEYSLLT